MPSSADPPGIFVLAGPNGGGKSSIGGAMIRHAGSEYYNPDEATRLLANANPGLSVEDANALAWRIGFERLATATATRTSFAFETTLGGKSITDLLSTAPASGVALHIWYVALASAELHVARVRARVLAGGHDIPEDKIRTRYDSSRLNLLRLFPVASSVRVFDNSAAAADGVPNPVQILTMRDGRITDAIGLPHVPAWAKPLMMEAIRVDAAESARRSL